MTETIFSPQDPQFVTALSYASVRGQYVDFYLKDKSPHIRAFVARVAVSSHETLIELTSGRSLHVAEIDYVSVYFDTLSGGEALSCLCQ